MFVTQHLAKHFREVYFGVNWTSSDLRTQLSGVSWQEANTRVSDLNTIVALVYHIHYYVRAILKVLDGGPLDAKDRYSFNHPPIESEDDWDEMLATFWAEAETFATRLEILPEEELRNIFVEEKYGSYLRNFMGLIEHIHYHLGQIVIIKKILRGQQPDE